jgi:hypothetical protein
MKYNLKYLMYEKYGEDRFALACEIVGRWVQFETKNKYFNATWIEKICAANELSEVELPLPAAEALRRLFGLSSFEELFV